MEFQRVHEFLSRLCSEFEPRRAHLLARGRVPISEVLAELRAEETRLRSAGLLLVPSVLAARTPVSSARLTAPPLLPTPSGGWVVLLMLRGAGRAVTPSVATALGPVTQSMIAVRRNATSDASLPVGLLDLPRLRHSLTRT